MPYDLHSKNAIFDALCELHDGGLITVSAEGKVDAVAVIFDTGGGRTMGNMVVDITALEVDSTDETYAISVQGSSQSDFSSDLADLVILSLGYADAIASDVNRGALGERYIVPWTNVFGDVTFRYLRAYCEIIGTIATGIDYTAFLTK